MIDLTLAADNAIVVGMAASRVQPNMRAKVIFWGIAGAVVLRIIFASITQQLLQVIGLTLAGGILLLFVCWKMYRQIVDSDAHSIDEVEKEPRLHGSARQPCDLLERLLDHHHCRLVDVARQRSGGRRCGRIDRHSSSSSA